MKNKLKKLCLSLFAAALALTSLVTSGITIAASGTEDIISINAKLDAGGENENNKFYYYPSTKWKAGVAANEYFTTVDTSQPANNDVYYTIKFEGTGIEVFGFKAPSHAIIEFSIDGGDVKTVDTYAASRPASALKLVEYKNLENKEHTLKCKATGTKNANARGANIQVTRADIFKPKATASNVTFKNRSAELFVGQEYQIEYDTEPVGAALPEDFVFATEDESILTVDETGKVTAHGSGTAMVSGDCQSLGIYNSMTITVKEKDKLHVTVVDSNDQFQQKAYDSLLKVNETTDTLWSWKNDKAISEIAILSGSEDLNNVRVEIGQFENEKGTILDSDAIQATFITEALGFIGNAGWYSINPNAVMPTGPKEYYFDIIDTSEPLAQLGKDRVQLVWLDFNAGKDTQPGTYTGQITVTADGLTEGKTIDYTFEVIDLTFDDTEDYTFRPNYWTYPFSSAEYYEVEPFSPEHIDILRTHLLQYKEYGGVTLTASLVEEAWGGQTYGEIDPANGDDIRCPSLIKWTKKADGTWSFDYDYFDKFVEVAESIGIGDDIVLYSMIPWNDRIIYYDEASGTVKKDTVSISNKTNYASYWRPFLVDFTAHLDAKDWFDKVSIGFDERAMMKNVFDLIDEVKNKDGKSFKKKGAYNHIFNGDGVPPRMEDLSYNLNLLRNNIADFKPFLADRKEKGLSTTFYTGTDVFPNSFLRSLPAESYWTMMFSGSLGVDGFLDWAYDAWVEDPLVDTTHYSFQPGDCFMVYPSPKDAEKKVTKASIRSEKYGEGIRDINKLYRMQEAYPELAQDIEQLFSTVKSNYAFDLVNNQPGWAYAGGKPARWITEAGRQQILVDVSDFKDQLYTISKKYEELSAPDEVLVDSIEFADDEIILEKDESKEIEVTINPEDATNKELVWESGDTDIVEVVNGTVTAKKSGSTIITVTSADNNATAQINVTVKADFTALNKAIKDAADIDSSKYTDESLENLNHVLADANVVAANEKATQAEVDQAADAVNKALADLQEKDDGNDPDNPNQPDNPDKPDQPDNPDNPDKPGKPDDSDKPDTPDNPDKPDTPNKPDKPNNPNKPSNPIGPNKPLRPGYVNQLNSADNKVSIIGKFPDDIELIIEDLPSDAKENTIASIVNKEVVAKYTFEKIFDIYMLRNGATYTPKGNYSVKIKLDDDLAAKRYLGIAYIADNGTVTMVPSKVQNGYITFTTNHNSYYAIVSSDAPIVDTATTSPIIDINGFSFLMIGMMIAFMIRKSDGVIRKE